MYTLLSHFTWLPCYSISLQDFGSSKKQFHALSVRLQSTLCTPLNLFTFNSSVIQSGCICFKSCTEFRQGLHHGEYFLFCICAVFRYLCICVAVYFIYCAERSQGLIGGGTFAPRGVSTTKHWTRHYSRSHTPSSPNRASGSNLEKLEKSRDVLICLETLREI